ncbi:Threonine aldolase [Dehalogenimonas lykanthroporepellens BL-DC-9]|nr:Threonine aldolase [Dehalogenimonas lykanthroporepellens BL-DC-9]
MNVIDLRSDTITHPTPEMRRAMFEAEVGDDVFGEDPTVNRLEALSAEMTGKEAGLYTPSGTMSNLIAVLAHTRRGDEIILGDRSHIFLNEAGGAAVFGGLSLRTVPNADDGTIELDVIEQAVRDDNIHFPPSTLLCLENTHNFCGGAPLSAEYTRAAGETARQYGLKVHLDGARLFNAAVALKVTAAELCAPTDSVCLCLSKGLSAPVGSVLCGDRDFINRARKLRKMCGGGMRQAGVIAAAGITALETMTERLSEDHANARRLAEGLSRLSGIEVEMPQTNIVLFRPGSDAGEFVNRAESAGVRLIAIDRRQARAVTHRMVTTEDIDEAVRRLAGLTGN